MLIPPIDHEKNKALRKRSGEVNDSSKLVSLLYGLLRDHITVGTLEQLMHQGVESYNNVKYTNGYLAKYAQDVAKRISPEGQDESLLSRLNIVFDKRKEALEAHRRPDLDPDQAISLDYHTVRAILEMVGRKS